MNLEFAQSFRYDLNFTYQEKDGTVRVFKEFTEALKLVTRIRFDLKKQEITLTFIENLTLDVLLLIEFLNREQKSNSPSRMVHLELRMLNPKNEQNEGVAFFNLGLSDIRYPDLASAEDELVEPKITLSYDFITKAPKE